MAKKKKVNRKSSAAGNQPTFEQSLAELETIVAELESGELGLGDALARYERGIGRLKQCHAELAQAARKIELLSGVDASGNPITEPFDDEELKTVEKKKGARSKRRTASKRTGNAAVDDGGRLF
ncbi:MAG: exodeoxyribonuclease VII small subunit [Aeoliella sp.]